MHSAVKIILKKLGIYHFLFNQKRLLNDTLVRFQNRKNKGGGYTCNFCNSEYKRFLSRDPAPEDREALIRHQVVFGGFDNVFCPNCRSNARERLVKYALDKYGDWQGKSVLQFSPERSLITYLRKYANVISADLEPEIYYTIDKNIRKEDITRITFPDNTFDMVVANHVLEHVPDDRKAMQEIFRVLKAGGRAVLQVPYSISIPQTIEEPHIVDPQKQSQLFGQKDHVRIYNLHDYLRRLKECGFKVSYITYEDLIDSDKHAFQKDEGFIDCVKPVL